MLTTEQPAISVTGPTASDRQLRPSPTVPDAYLAGGDIDLGLLFSVILSSLGMLGNALVCFVMLRNRKVFFSTTNKLIIHQSSIDFVASAVFLVRRFALGAPPIPGNFLGSLYCRVWWSEWPMYGMFVTSTYNLVVISTERYLVTCHPVKHRNMFSPFRLKVIMLAAWLAGWIPAAHLTLICYHDHEALDCGSSWPSPEVQATGGILIFVHEIIVPISIMVFTYSRIIWSLRQRSRVREEENNAAAREMLSKANRNVTITLIVVAVFFAVCWLPTDIYYLLYNLNLHQNFVGHPVYQVVSVVVVLNLCVNPIIYCFAYDRFRKQLRGMFCGRRCRARRVDGTEDRTTSTFGNSTVPAARSVTTTFNRVTVNRHQPAACSQALETFTD